MEILQDSLLLLMIHRAYSCSLSPAGSIEGKTRDYSLRVERNFQDPAEFARLPISRDPNEPVVRLGDVALWF